MTQSEKLMERKRMTATTADYCPEAQTEQPSLVHPLETSAHAPLPLRYQDFRAQPHREEFQAALDLYCRVDLTEHTTRAERLLECRQWAWFARHKVTGMVKVVSNSCHLRWCPICAESKKNMISANVREWLSGVRRPKFFTLTVQSSNDPLKVQVDRLYKQFRSFRRHKTIKKHIRGGVWFFQLTWRPKAKQWHPHLHCVLDADYISQRILSQEWLQTTGNSFVVDIRAIRDTTKAVNDIARYSSRPCSLAKFKGLETKDIYDCFRGKRLCGSFGTGKSVLLRPKKTDEANQWQRLPNWQVVIRDRATNPAFEAIIKAWSLCKPIDLDIITSVLPQIYDENTVEMVFLSAKKAVQLSFEGFH